MSVPLSVARSRIEGSAVQDFANRLKSVDFLNATAVLGAMLLLSVLPLLIVLSGIADQKIDDDLSRHIGLDSHGAAIVRSLFRSSPAHDTGSVVTAVIFGLAGTVAVVSQLQLIYERTFDQAHRGWRDIGRFVLWVAVLVIVLVGEGASDGVVRDAAGRIVEALWGLVGLTVFFWWSMHLLLAGRVPWRTLLRPALLTAIFWVGLAAFSSTVFSSTIVSDSRLYGTVGVVFTLLSWVIAIGAVMVLGAAGGAAWQARRGR